MWGHCSFLLDLGAYRVLFVLSKSLFPQSCVSSDGSMVGLTATSSKRAYAIAGLLHPEPLPLQQSTADPYLCRRHSNTVLAQSLWDIWVLVHTRFCLCQSCVQFWWLYGGVNGDLLQEGLCHTKVHCSQSPCPCSSPLLTHTSSGDTQTQFCLSVWGLWVLMHRRYV